MLHSTEEQPIGGLSLADDSLTQDQTESLNGGEADGELRYGIREGRLTVLMNLTRLRAACLSNGTLDHLTHPYCCLLTMTIASHMGCAFSSLATGSSRKLSKA